MSEGIKIEGFKQFRKALKNAETGLTDLKEANAAAASIVADTAKGRTPYKTGRLRGNIRGNKAAGRAVVIAGGARVPYAGPIHFGWPRRGIRAQPFVYEAISSSQGRWLDAYTKDVQAICDKVNSS